MAAGEIDIERKQRAPAIARRVLATLYRYMLGGTEPTRERVLLAGIEGDEQTLGLQMMHDQLAAAGYQTILDTDLARAPARADRESSSRPDRARRHGSRARRTRWSARSRSCARRHPDIPIVLGGRAVGGELPRERDGMRVLERIDESVEAVEELLAAPARLRRPL